MRRQALPPRVAPAGQPGPPGWGRGLAAYAELVRVRFLTMLAYRANFWTGAAVYLVYIGVYHFLWQAVYEQAGASGRAELGGFTAVQMTSYLAVAWTARSFWFNNLDREMAAEVRAGTVAVELLRPYSYLLSRLAGALGEGVFRLVFYAVPGFLLAAALFPVRLPALGWGWLPFALALFLGFAVNSLVNVLCGLAAFYWLNVSGFLIAKRVLVDVLAGVFVPLNLYPDWARGVLAWLPFQAIGFLPGAAFAGALPAGGWGRLLAVQAAWVGVLAAVAAAAWGAARRRLVVQGG